MAGRNFWKNNTAYRATFRTTRQQQIARNKRVLQQIEWEGTQGNLRWYEVEDGRVWKAHKRRLRDWGMPYKNICQPGGRVVVIAASATALGQRGCLLPDNPGRIIQNWLKQALPGRRIDGSRGFGGPWSGSRPPSEGLALALGYTLEAFAGAVKSEGWPYSLEFNKGGGLTNVDLPPEYDERVRALIKHHRHTFSWTSPGVYDN